MWTINAVGLSHLERVLLRRRVMRHAALTPDELLAGHRRKKLPIRRRVRDEPRTVAEPADNYPLFRLALPAEYNRVRLDRPRSARLGCEGRAIVGVDLGLLDRRVGAAPFAGWRASAVDAGGVLSCEPAEARD